MRHAAGLVAIFVLLLAALALKGALLTLPAPPATADSAGFDANRAATRLGRILGDERPHPVDSVVADALRERLIAEMRTVGLEPRVTDAMTCNGAATSRAIACARVRNLIATIGPAEGRHAMLVAHYDSSFAGPGAADDGIGVATLLEVADRLRGRTLARPISFQFNEGEEMGLLGARAFLDSDPLAGRIDTLLNFEARGVTGPAAMFETSRPNRAAMTLYRAAVARPSANSLSTDLYGLIPNSTDVTVFAERDWTILNFAVIGNETRYHSMGDDLAALDRRSLQHMGEQALQLTERLATGEAPAANGGALIYMDLLGRTLVALPMLVGLVLLGLLLVFFLVVAKRRRAFGRSLLAMAAALLGGTALAFAGDFLVGLLRPGDYWRGWPVVTTTAVYASALAAAVAALLLIARDAERGQLRAAFWLVYVGLGAGLSAVAPGASIFFLAPPLLVAAGMALGSRLPWAETTGAIAAALFLFVTLGAALSLFEELMSAGPLWMFAPLGALLLLPALVELQPFLQRPRRLWTVALALDLAILGWIGAGVAPAYTADRQQLFTIEYVWDESARAGRFAVNNDGAPVPFDAVWARTEFPYSARRRWATPAPAVAVPAPALTPLASAPIPGGGRRLRLRLAANGAEAVTLIAPADAALRAARIGASVRRFGGGGPTGRYFLRCVGRACDGAEIEIVTDSAAPVEFTLVGTRSGLPPVAAPLVAARPALARPQYGSDSTIAIGRSRL